MLPLAHILFGRPCLKRLKVITDHADNTYTFKWNGHQIQLKPMETPFLAKQATPSTSPHILTMQKLEVESKEQSVMYALVTKHVTDSKPSLGLWFLSMLMKLKCMLFSLGAVSWKKIGASDPIIDGDSFSAIRHAFGKAIYPWQIVD